MIRRYHSIDPTQKNLPFEADSAASVDTESSPQEIVVDPNPWKLDRHFDHDSVFEQENQTRKNVHRLLTADGSKRNSATDATQPIDFSDTESVRALLEEVRTLPARDLFTRVIRAGLTTVHDELRLWEVEMRRTKDTGDKKQTGKRWALGQRAHLDFFNSSRRGDFIGILSKIAEGHATTPETAERLLQQDLRGAIREILEKSQPTLRRKPR